MAKRLFVYILECSDGSYYTGVTNNIEKRLKDHERGYLRGCYTFERRPVQLIYLRGFESAYKAIAFEKQVKGWTRAKKKALIQNNITELISLSNHNKLQKSSPCHTEPDEV